MSRVIIIPYKMGSQAARSLKESLIEAGIPALQVKPDSRKFRPRRSDLTIFYGGTSNTTWPILGRTMNATRQHAQNKLNALRKLQEAGVNTVEWTTDAEVAKEWPTIVARATLTGHSGQGITVHQQGEQLPRAPLYTKYMKKTFECRIHVMNGSVIDGQIKRRRTGAEDVNTLIRNAHTGWVYCRDGYVPSDQAKAIAISAVSALGLDFGAVDLIYNQHYDQYYCLEVNTAPGLEGTTLTNYVSAIQNV